MLTKAQKAIQPDQYLMGLTMYLATQIWTTILGPRLKKAESDLNL